MSFVSKIFQTKNTIKRIFRTRYPSYLFGLLTKEDQSPAFIFHDIEKNDFTDDLEFLARNNYETLSTEQWIQNRINNINKQSVLLTFDDARKNFFEVTFPLLKKYNAKATLFVPTRWIAPFDTNIVDTQPLPIPANTFMNWSELKECADSGLVDIQSHAHRHALVYTSDQLIGFATPSLLSQHDLYDWPMRHENGKDILGPPPLGTPIYTSVPLLSAERRIFEDEQLSIGCQKFITDNGGDKFFLDSDAVSKLTNFYNTERKNNNNFKTMPSDIFKEQVISEFELSTKLFEQNLGFKPKYFAYPWMLGSNLSLGIANTYDIDTVFGVGIDYRRAAKQTSQLHAFGRTKGDWLRFMPGTGRSSLHKVIPKKITGIFSSQHLAH